MTNETKKMTKEKQRKITGKIVLLSGTRIGGSDTLLEIGGVDSGQTCIKHPITYKPYLPGSSLKGKMRAEIEKQMGRYTVGNQRGKEIYEPCGCGGCMVCRVFGAHKNLNHNLGPTRLLIRDAQLLEGGEFEIKSSTSIDRRSNTALAGSLRTEERIVAGSIFGLEIGVQVWNIDNTDETCEFKGFKGEEALIEFLKECLRLVERTGIGAGTSKGSGQIKFVDLKLDGAPFDL